MMKRVLNLMKLKMISKEFTMLYKVEINTDSHANDASQDGILTIGATDCILIQASPDYLLTGILSRLVASAISNDRKVGLFCNDLDVSDLRFKVAIGVARLHASLGIDAISEIIDSKFSTIPDFNILLFVLSNLITDNNIIIADANRIASLAKKEGMTCTSLYPVLRESLLNVDTTCLIYSSEDSEFNKIDNLTKLSFNSTITGEIVLKVNGKPYCVDSEFELLLK